MQPREIHPVRHRQHGNVRIGVLSMTMDSQRPEVRRRPGEDDEEQQQRMRIDRAGHRRPPEHRRHRPGRAPDDDVLRSRPLEEETVDHGIPDERAEGQHRRQRVDAPGENRHGEHAQHRGEHRRGGRVDLSAREWPAARPRHDGVYPAIGEVIDGGSRRGGASDTESTEHQRVERHHCGAREQHADDCREDDQRHDLRLAQRDIVAPPVGTAKGQYGGRRHGAPTGDEGRSVGE